MGDLTLHVPAMTASALPAIRQFVTASLRTLGCAGATDALVLAVDEVCANIAEHGFDPDPPGPALISVRSDGSDAIIVVDDSGRPFTPGDAPPPDLDSDWQDRRVGGLGWYLIQQMVDVIQYEPISPEPGMTNRLTLTKRHATTVTLPEGS